jgi:hypothetical protein
MYLFKNKQKKDGTEFNAGSMLNKIIRISRSTDQNYIEDSRVYTLRRYSILTFTYSLTKIGLGSSRSGDVRVITR